jgi:UDP-N-acetylglucosamine--N-acetylmuramyl-(pentapeptide) pyrophosphoryl-undecaprenol N-acetylglucosamine transferase
VSRGVVIAGGGTGGHIYPAIAIAQALRKMDPKIPIDFVGTQKGLETKIVPRENFPLHFVNVGALNGVGIVIKLTTLLILPLAILQAAILLFKLRPKIVLGVGGYASGPVMLAGILMRPFLGLRLALFEPNAFPGLTNRWLAKLVDDSFTNFEVTTKFFKSPHVVGIPVREGLMAQPVTNHQNLRVLIFGGSQGAHGINVTVLDAMKKSQAGAGWLQGVEIVHQIGARDFKEMDEEYKKLQPPNVTWFEFLYDMPERYKWCDLVICRAGASTLAELAACQKAAVLVPFPFAADNHQKENAEAMVKRNAAVMILQNDFTADKLIDVITQFRKNPERTKTFEREIGKFYRPQSAEKIAVCINQSS